MLEDSHLLKPILPLVAQETPATSAPLLVSIRRERGMCARLGCFSEVAILLDGTYRYTTHRTRPVTGNIAPADLQQLRTRIANTDFNQIHVNPKTDHAPYDLCLLTVDGPETVYRFAIDRRVEEIRGCKTRIDASSPLVQQLESLYKQISEQAVTEEVVIPDPNDPLPKLVADTVRRTFLRDYGNRLTNVRVTSARPVTWDDCPPDRPANRHSYQPCERRSRPGWFVVMQGEFPTLKQSIARAYYTDGDDFPWRDRNRFAVLDTVSSLTDAQLAQVATRLNLPQDQLQIVAAQEESFYPAIACPPGDVCPIPPLALGWRVLVQQGVNDRIVRVTSLKTPLSPAKNAVSVSEDDRPKLGTLPLALANVIMQDASERFATAELFPTPYPKTGAEVEFRLDSVKSVTWNHCRGGEGPSTPIMGTCPDVTLTGWRMIVRGGLKQQPFRLVYYIPHHTEASGLQASDFITAPDGLQSLPDFVQTRILQAISEQIKIPVSEIQLHWVEAKLFDRCLNVGSSEVLCKSEIRPGWRIEVLANSPKPTTSWGYPRWIYHTNLTGSNVRLINQGFWSPPPSAPPPSLPQ
jgi:hypothetical protein